MDMQHLKMSAVLSFVSSVTAITINQALPYLGRAIIPARYAPSLISPFGISNIALLALVTTIQTVTSIIFLIIRSPKDPTNEHWFNANLLTAAILTRLTALAMKTNLIASRLSLPGTTLLFLSSLAAPILYNLAKDALSVDDKD